MRRTVLVRPGAFWPALGWRALKLLLIALVAAAPISDAAFAKKKNKQKHWSQNHHQNDFAWRVRNNSGEVVQYQVYSTTRPGHVWPGGGQVRVVSPDGRTYVDPISCEKGEKICYGAWLARDKSQYWGAGSDGKQSCADCCYVCGGFSQVIGFGRPVVVARPAEPAQPDDEHEAETPAPPVTPVPTPAQVSCGDALASARRLANSMHVDLIGPSVLSAGEKIKVSWSGGSAADTPTYLVVDAPEEVRFTGTGFLPLTPNARAPSGLKHASSRTRAFVPLHRGTLASGGSFSVIPERAGQQQIGWTIVSAGTCGESVLAQGTPRQFTVGLGAPKIVVQDRFADDKPLKRFRHSSGRYDLLVFKGRYEVRDAKTDELVLVRAGIDPNFSPTGRFVAARREVDNNIEVLDLVSGDLVETFDNGLLAWVLNDSIAIFSASQYGQRATC